MKNKLTLSQKLVILMIIINMFFVIKDRFFGISNSSTFYIILVVIELNKQRITKSKGGILL